VSSTPATTATLRRPRLLAGIVAALLVVMLLRAGRLSSDMLTAFALMLPSVAVHELAHGVVAWRFGDPTVRDSGRLSLRPGRHLDPIGSLVVPALSILAGFGYVGWAKRLKPDGARLRPGRNVALAVALAGPLANLLLVGAAWVGFALTWHPAAYQTTAPLGPRVFFYLGLVNLWLVLVNLLPIPPLDGAVVLERLLPSSAWPRYLRIRPYLLPCLLGVVVASFLLNLGLLDHVGSWLAGRWISLLPA
jgi:Zn-dependent protease